jgi:hypothetical protein
MRRAEDIKRLFKKAGLGIRPDADERVFADMLQARQEAPEIRPGMPESMWRVIMKNPITKLAIAAAVLIACIVGLYLWRTTGSGIALADVLARVEKVSACSLKWSMSITIADPNGRYHYEGRGTGLTSQEYGSKNTHTCEESDRNGSLSTFEEIYFLPRKNVRIHIRPGQKQYVRVELNDMYVKRERGHGGLQLQNDPLGYLKNMLKYEYENLGRSTIDGIDVAGFGSTDPNMWPQWNISSQNPQFDVKLWVDVKTLLPVRYEYVHVRQTGDRTKDQMHMVFSDFQWNVSADAAEFEPAPIPNGYTIEDHFPDVANEETATEGLQQCVELLGRYPDTIDLTYLWSESEKTGTSAALRLREELRGFRGFERDSKKMDAVKPMRFLCKFYRGLAEKDPAYYGKTITPPDDDKVLLRWKLSDKEYRVIFGDLHAETVSPEKLAELEKSMPK